MHKVLLFAYCALSVSFASSSFSNISQKLDIPLNKSGTLLKTIFEGVSTKNVNRSDSSKETKIVSNSNQTKVNKNGEAENKGFHIERHKHSKNEAQISLPILQKIHARITRSKDAVWATITLTFICILLVLAVAQSRMWKDHYYTEAQGVPLPNFNERVLFKDVMEHKISSLKQFFKKKKPKENVTELESLLPPSEWDN